MKIIDSFWKYNYPIRAIRIKGSMLSNAFIKQISMFDNDKDYSMVMKMIDDKYGKIELASNMVQYINKSPHPQE